jgi:hypothetical protein
VEGETDAKLRQFEVLWAEIARRSNAQQTLVGVGATAIGTVGGLVVADKANAVLFVVLAVVSPVFGLLWLDHALNIGQIADFIARHWDWQPNWEKDYESRKHGGAGRIRYVIFMLSMTLVFLAPAVAGLIASFGHLDGHGGRLAGWIGAVLLTALFTVAWLIQVGRGWRRADGV